MNAYLFSAGATHFTLSQSPERHGTSHAAIESYDSCVTTILCGGDLARAQKRFEAWCQPPAEEAVRKSWVEIKRIVSAKFVDQMLTEAGPVAPDWPKLAVRMKAALESTPGDEFEEGYWVDVNQAVPPGQSSPDLESLKRGLPEDIGSGLNWSADKQFFFLLGILKPWPNLELPADDVEAAEPGQPVQSANEIDEAAEPELEIFMADLPQLREKEAAVLVEARNAVVAVWLWRNFSANSWLAAHELNILPGCDVIPVEEPPESGDEAGPADAAGG
jgi:hypothetical protein